MTAQHADLWLTRWYYFIALGGTGFIAPFLNLFYVRVDCTRLRLSATCWAGCACARRGAWKRKNERADGALIFDAQQ
jgi:hypothetical protein